MASKRQFGKRRVAVVAGGVLGISALAAAHFAGPALAASAAAQAAYQTPLVAGTPCTITAKSCVDLESQKAWLFDNGKIIRGPVPISSGGNGKETPIGHSLRVYRKEKDHKSLESRLPNGQPAPMPWSVFFEDGGIAFHAGSPSRSSSGCIHLNTADAQAWFNYLQIGDQVQVVRASQEYAARKGQPVAPAPADNGGDNGDHGDDGDHGDSGDHGDNGDHGDSGDDGGNDSADHGDDN